MGARLHIIDQPHDYRHGAGDLDAGSMWRVPDMDTDGLEAWAIVLPGAAGLWFTTQTAGRTNERWTVTGTPPDLTVTPSINAEPHWHGWITNGEMTP